MGQWAGCGALPPVLGGSREAMGVRHLDWGCLTPGRELARWVPSTGSGEGGIETDGEH